MDGLRVDWKLLGPRLKRSRSQTSKRPNIGRSAAAIAFAMPWQGTAAPGWQGLASAREWTGW